MSKPDVEHAYFVWMGNGMYKFVVRGWGDAPDCCAIHYEDEHTKTEPLNLGPTQHAREIAHTILKWCDEQDKQDASTS